MAEKRRRPAEDEIEAALKLDTTAAAAALGVSPTTIQRWRRARGIARPVGRPPSEDGATRRDVSLYLSIEALEAAQVLAELRGVSLSQIVDQAIQEWVARHGDGGSDVE